MGTKNILKELKISQVQKQHKPAFPADPYRRREQLKGGGFTGASAAHRLNPRASGLPGTQEVVGTLWDSSPSSSDPLVGSPLTRTNGTALLCLRITTVGRTAWG